MIIQTTKELRPRAEHDEYPTSLAVAKACLARSVPWQAMVDYWRSSHGNVRVFDPGCGSGSWGQAALDLWGYVHVSGLDIQHLEKPKGYDYFFEGDFLTFETTERYHLVIGNPPYKFAEEFVRRGLKMLRPGGRLIFLLRLGFLEGQERGKNLWKHHPPATVYVMSARPSFIHSGEKAGKTDATPYGLFVWRNNWRGAPTIEWLDWKDPRGQQIGLF